MTIGMGSRPSNGPSKGKVKNAEWHTAPTKYGMGDYYGTGIKNKVGRIREEVGNSQVTPNKLKKPPKSLA